MLAAIILAMIHPGNIFFNRKERGAVKNDRKSRTENGPAPFDAMPAIRRNAIRSLENQNPKTLLKRNAVVPTPFRRMGRCVVAEPFVERHRANAADVVHNGVVAHIDADVAPNRTRIRMGMGRR